MSNFVKLINPYVKTNTHKLEAFNLSDTNYWIFILRGWLLANDSLKGTLTNTPQIQRIDINGQTILPVDYEIEEWKGEAVIVKFIKANFPYSLDMTDDIRVTGMFKQIPI